MNCRNCGAGEQEGNLFCSKCGYDLKDINQEFTRKFEAPIPPKKMQKSMKKVSKIIGSSKLHLVSGAKKLQKSVKKFSGNVHSKNIELYKKTKELHKAMKQKRKNNNSKQLVITEGWNWVTEDNYTYLRGSVKNIGSKAINHFEVNIKYKDVNDNVLDSDFTEWDRKIEPGECKEFEIKHRISVKYKSVDVSLNNYKKFSWK
ncbi:FxLYD domain-containing protein [Clostridium sp.]